MHFTRHSSYENGGAGADHRARRGRLHLRRPAASATSTAWPGCSSCRSGTAARSWPRPPRKQAKELAFFPLWSYAHPQGDRAGRAAGPVRARRPEPGLLHHRWRRGRRDRVEAGQAVLQADRQADEAQGDQPRRSPTTAPRRARCRSPASRSAKKSFEPLVPGRPQGAQHQLLPRARARATTPRRSAAGPPTGSTRPSSSRAPTRSPPSSSSRCRTPAAASRRRPATSSGCARSATSTTCCSSPTRSSARSAGSASMFACDDFGYVPDIITCAKGMTSGYSPIGAMIASDRLFEPFKHGHNYFPHGYTFGGHPVSAAVALANLDIFEREGLNDHVHAERGRVPGDAGEAARPADRRRRARRRATSTGSSWSRTRPPRRRSTTTSPSGCCAASSPRRCSTPACTAGPTTAATRWSSWLRR